MKTSRYIACMNVRPLPNDKSVPNVRPSIDDKSELMVNSPHSRVSSAVRSLCVKGREVREEAMIHMHGFYLLYSPHLYCARGIMTSNLIVQPLTPLSSGYVKRVGHDICPPQHPLIYPWFHLHDLSQTIMRLRNNTLDPTSLVCEWQDSLA